MHCNEFMLSYRGYSIWIRTTGCDAGDATVWSAAWQLGLNKLALHQYIDAAGQHRSERTAAARAVRCAKIDIDRRLKEGDQPTPHPVAAGKISAAWLMRLAESRQRKL